MKPHAHLSELRADDVLLDRLAARADAGSEPVVVLLSALARHADTPLRTARSSRRVRRHRALTAMAVVVLGASGVGAAAAVTQPGRVWHSRDSLRMTQLEAGGHTATSTPVPAPTASVGAPRAANGAYALIRDAAGRIVLLPSGAGDSGAGAGSSQAVQGTTAAPDAARLRAAAVDEAQSPRPSFFLSDSNSVAAGKRGIDAAPGKIRALTGEPGGSPALQTLTLAPTPAPTPAPTGAPTRQRPPGPRLSAVGGASPGPVLDAADGPSASAAESRDRVGSPSGGLPEEAPEPKAPGSSETATSEAPVSGTSKAPTAETQEQLSQRPEGSEAPGPSVEEAPPAAPLSSPSPG